MSPSRGSTPIAGKPAASPQPTVSTAIATDVSSQVETAVQPSAHEHSATTYQTSAKRSMDVSKIGMSVPNGFSHLDIASFPTSFHLPRQMDEETGDSP